MTDEDLANTLPQLKWFLIFSTVPWAIMLFGNSFGLPTAVGIGAFIVNLFVPLVSLWYSIPIAKLLRQSISLQVVVALAIPFGYLISGIVLFRRAKKQLASGSQLQCMGVNAGRL